MKTVSTILSFLVMTVFAFAQTPTITNVSPSQGQRGQTLNLQITGTQTNFTQASNIAVTIFNSATAIRANAVSVLSNTSLIANITIPLNAAYQNCDLAVSASNLPLTYKPEAFAIVNASGKMPAIKSFTPTSATIGQTLDLTITGANTNFTQATQVQTYFYSQASSIIVNNVNVINDSTLVTNISVGANTSVGYYPFYVNGTIDGRLNSPGLGLFVKQPGNTPYLALVTPNEASLGQTLNLTITGVNVDFTQASGTFNAYFFHGATQLTGTNNTILSPTQIKTTLSIPHDVGFAGSYNLVLQEVPSGNILNLQNAIYVGFTIGIKNESLKPTYNIYPNPTKDELFIDTKQIVLSIGLMSTTGQTVVIRPEDLEEQMNGYRISTSKYGLPPGFYFIRIQTNDGYTYHKILIN